MKRLLSFLAVFLAFTMSASAAELSLTSATQSASVARSFKVVVTVDTQGESVNALEGTILFPADLIGIEKIETGDSFVNFWIQRPTLQREGVIAFSGITPGGYSGSHGVVFSLIFTARHSGSALFQAEGIRMFKNDGQGTPVDVRILPLEISVGERSSEVSRSSQASVLGVEDSSLPEPFLPSIIEDGGLFGGKKILIFAAQDKQSGIDHYEVRETSQQFLRIFDSWTVSESPYLLKDQTLSSTIMVRAVDKAGNERISEIPARYPVAWYNRYENWIVWIAIIGIIIAARRFL